MGIMRALFFTKKYGTGFGRGVYVGYAMNLGLCGDSRDTHL